MNTVIVYYSLEGHTRKVCEEVAKRLDAKLVELTCVRPYATSGPAKYGRASKDTLLNKRPELNPYEFEASGVDLVVVATPCWAGKGAAPVNTFLAEHDLSGVRRAAIITCKAESGVRKYGQNFRAQCGFGEDEPVLSLCEAQIADATELSEAVDAFCERCRD